MQKSLTLALGLLIPAVWVMGCEDLKPIGARGTKSTSSASSSAPADSKDKVKLEMYIMSKCPYGVLAAQGIKPVLDEIGSFIDFHLDYIVNEVNGKFNSLHGEPEVQGNIIQLCSMKLYPEVKKYMGFIDCWNRNWRQIPANWESCADQAGMDKGRMKSCVEGNQGKDLLRESMARAKAARAQGSPTIKLAGASYNSGRSKTDFMRSICDKIAGNKPAACNRLPEEIVVNATILTDKRCEKCKTAGLENNLKMRFFKKLQVKKLDYSEPEGKRLYKELGLKNLPVFLFEPGVEKHEKYSQIARWMVEKGKYKQLRIPAQFDPTAEICDNKKDDTGNGKVDCADKTCKQSLVCRKEIPKNVQVFIMSQCPYGVKAVDAMKEVLENFKKAITFDVHYIADKTPKGFNSLHGQPEVDENIRQLCAKKYYKRNNKYLDYLWCRNKNYRSNDWKSCAKGGIKAAVIEKCSTGNEGKKLLEEDIKIAKALNVSGSPTWLANNRYKFSGIAANAIKTNLCRRNKGLAGCEKKLTEKAGVPAGSCGK